MALTTYTIPNLVQGVSQQPDAQRDPSQGEIQINGVSSIAEGLKKRNGSRALARVSTAPFGDAFMHEILRDQSEKYLAVVTSSGIKVFDLLGNQLNVNAPGGWSYLATVTDAKAQIRCSTVADYTFVSSLQKAPAMKSALAPATARPATYEVLVWVKAATYGNSYSLFVNGTTATYQTPVQAVIASGTTVIENRISTAEIATQLQTGLAGVSGLTISRAGSVLWLRSSSPITVAATDARGNSDITAILGAVQAFSELPTIAPVGYQIEVQGDPGNKFDGYYVQFQPRSGDFGEGAWLETVSPGCEFRLDEATMPHVLVRLPSGGFHFGPANGAVVSGVTLPAWGERTAGDYETAPDPSFIGRPVQDVGVYKNRLYLLADERIVLSRARDFFQFFPETVTTTLDSDPIDLTATNQRVSVLRYAVPYMDELIIFADQYQFRFGSSESALTPSTAQITVLTSYEIDPKVKPIAIAGAIVFCQTNGEWAQFREFSVRGAGTALVANADDLTGYVSSYIPAGVSKLASNDPGSEWFALTSGAPTRIYVHRFFYRNQGGGPERAQSSWSYWEFTGVGAILQIAVVSEILYLLVQRGEEVWLETIDVAARRPDANAPYQLLMDRRVSTGTDTPAALRLAMGSYNAATRRTTWTLPFQARAKTEVWTTFQNDANSAIKLASANSGNTLVAEGDWSTAQVFAGELFLFRYRFTRFKAYQEIGGGKAALNVVRTQIRHAKIRFHETGFFKAVVITKGRDPAVYTYPGVALGSANSVVGWDPDLSPQVGDRDGLFRIPIMSRGERAQVELQNETPLPCKFSTCEWVGEVTSLARR
jgi:hypothetical protein